MKLFWLLLIAIPFRSVSQDFTLPGNVASAGVTLKLPAHSAGYSLVSPQPETFCDTLSVYILFLTDTITGESKTRRVSQERKGVLEMCQQDCSNPGCLALHYGTCKNVQSSKYWYFIDGSQVFIDPKRILETYTAK